MIKMNEQPGIKRWAVVDIDYVREQYPTRTAGEIARDLGVSALRVRRLISGRRWRKNGSVRPKPVAPSPTRQICAALGRGYSRDLVLGATHAAPTSKKRATAPESAPADLMAFVAALSEREGARALGLSRGSVGRLRQGYWPDDPRKLLTAWQRYKARQARAVGGWFLRKVYPGGLVRHAGHTYTATGLAAHTGQLLAVTRAADGGLLAQTLNLPAERIALAPVHIGEAS